MGLNKQKGNMYGFVTHTWNVIKGRCSHGCSYCYMKRFPQKELRLVERELKTNLGEGNFIFVGSSTDMFAEDVPKQWILKVLDYCRKFNNEYLFQTKNPERMAKFIDIFPEKSMFGTTIETNREYKVSKSPMQDRFFINFFPKKMITIEPIMDFDLDMFVTLIIGLKPNLVNIGADSNKISKLIEPSEEKIGKLIERLEKFTKVNLKDNLKRLYNN